MRDPEILYYENVLSATECKTLIRHARRRLERSEVVDHETGVGTVHPIRTSSGMSFKKNETRLVSDISERVSSIFQWPAGKTEPLSLLRYRPGEFYNEHYDFFDYATSGSLKHRQRGGNRVGTLILYLNDCEKGGETLFADLGLEVYPKAGCAVYFGYPNPHFASMTRHAGRPPLRGEKWIATIWFKEGVYSSSGEHA
jgi:prolyl 4-hydroxylase